MSRERLPDRRRAVNIDFRHVTPDGASVPFRATLGYYHDGRLGEVFLQSSKIGTDADVAIKDAAILLSFALQHGCTVEDVRLAMTRSAAGAPEGAIGTLIDLIANLPPEPPLSPATPDRPSANI